ncbi:MAG: hypothetical protein V1816_26965 [Pseudomonadota bacterium]
MGKNVLVVLVLLGVLFLCGCGTKAVVYETDQMVLDETQGGLDFRMVGFSWRYEAPLNQIRVVGRARNATGEPVQGCRMSAVAYDQYGEPFGTSSIFLYPTFLEAESESDFELTFPGGMEVVNLYLRCRFEKRY